MRAQISWPGMPAEFAQAFKNIDFEEDLFSWSQLAELRAHDEDEDVDLEEWHELEWKTSDPTLRCQISPSLASEFAIWEAAYRSQAGVTLLNGPKSHSPMKQHPATVRVGFIGTAESIELGHRRLLRAARGVPGNDKHVAFPGYTSCTWLYSELLFQENWNLKFFEVSWMMC